MSDQKKLNRRDFLKGAAISGAGLAAVGALGASSTTPVAAQVATPAPTPTSAVQYGRPGIDDNPVAATTVAAPTPVSAIPVIGEKELTCDVLVVGGGTSGFSAGVKAAKDGAKVIIVEKTPAIGGDGLVAGTGCGTFGGGTDYQKAAGIKDTPELLYADLRKWDPAADPEVLKAYTDNTVTVCHYLRDLGVKFTLIPTPSPDFGDTVGRSHSVDGRGPALYKVLRPAFESAGGKILTETKGVKLLTDVKGVVLGATVMDKDGAFDIKAKATLLTCGGWQANYEMMVKYVGLDSPYALLRGLPTDTGDGVMMGLEVRAGSKGMERVHSYVHVAPYPMPIPFQPWLIVPPSETTGTGQKGHPLFGNMTGHAHCIVVNIRGERFADETKPRLGEQMANAILRQPEVRAYIISDKPLYDKYLKTTAEEGLRWAELGYPPVQIETADKIEDLAKKLGMNPGVLSSTVSEYNKAVADGTTALLRIPKTNKDPLGLYQKLGYDFLHKIETAPFYAVHITAGVSHSNGGITINAKGQVLDREKKVIPGLYAAGDTTVIWHSNYGGGFPAALVQGHIAGKNAAAALKP